MVFSLVYPATLAPPKRGNSLAPVRNDFLYPWISSQGLFRDHTMSCYPLQVFSCLWLEAPFQDVAGLAALGKKQSAQGKGQTNNNKNKQKAQQLLRPAVFTGEPFGFSAARRPAAGRLIAGFEALRSSSPW